MIPLTIPYDEYIDRPKLSEQKNPFENIVHPPNWGRNNNTTKARKIQSLLDCTVQLWGAQKYQGVILIVN